MVSQVLTFIFLLNFTLTVSAFSTQRGIASEEVSAASVEESKVQPCAGKQVEMCITMDRNPAVQKMLIYKNGKLESTLPISTGRETFDIPTNFNLSPGCSNTPTGVFEPQIMREEHYSNTWLVKNAEGKYADGALMPHSIFFKGGVALHAAGSVEAVEALGPKTDQGGVGSGGCVRLHPYDAKMIFDQIAACKKSEKKQVCINREVVLPTERKKTDGTTHQPRCLQMEEREVCIEYEGQPPRCTTTQIAETPGVCKDNMQKPVVKKAKTVAIEVTDSRPQSEIDAIRNKCLKDRDLYQQAKAECLIKKMPTYATQTQLNQFKSIESYQFSESKYQREQFSKAFEGILKSLGESTRSQMNYQCNEELYHKAQAQRAQMLANGQPIQGIQNTQNQSAQAAPLPTPQPERKRRPGLFGWFRNIFT
jgi:hypothetical protein